MENNKFLKRLNELLSKIPEQDRKEMLYDFEEHFSIGVANGRSEQEMIDELGDPNIIARDLLAEYRITRAESDQSLPNITKAVIATISLSFFNLVFILGPVLGIFGVYVGLCATAFILTISPLAIIGSIIFNGFEDVVFLTFASMVTCSLGILLSIAMIYVGKFLYRTILTYIRFNVRIIKGEKGVEAA
ncbi:HAAS signaling domain-containing protein [Bacillus sp. AK128]